jgi:hypothetical protein
MQMVLYAFPAVTLAVQPEGNEHEGDKSARWSSSPW